MSLGVGTSGHKGIDTRNGSQLDRMSERQPSVKYVNEVCVSKHRDTV